MKVSEIPYRRYTIEEGRRDFDAFRTAVKNAASVEDMLRAHDLYQNMRTEYETAACLVNCRFTCNTKDPFYQEEVSYYDEVEPLFSALEVEYADLMLSSPYRAEMEKHLNPRIFRKMEISKKAFDPIVTEDCQEENAVVTEYSKFMSEMVFIYDGEEMPLSVLRGKLEDSDREVRRRAAEAIGEGLGKNREKLDDIYDRLVKIRDRIAKKMGYRNFVELGYYRMGRMDYDADMVRRFRDNVARDLVPAVKKLKREIADELGIGQMMFYDNDVYGKGETPRPHVGIEQLFEEAQKMYDEMDPDVGAFMRSMREAEAFDVEPRDGKWGGGYCEGFRKYKQPFILANFNGSCGDVDVITHEFGHAYAGYCMYHGGDAELDVGGMETAECHSMSMEFFCWKGTERFFGADADKYRKKHLLDAFSFIPYGVIVDEFQEIVYEHPEYTPAERDAVYLALEKKYRPYLSFEGIPYLELGTRWQYQMHIYETPFYYIDYCLAQTVAIGFLIESRKDWKGAFDRYLRFLRAGGQKAFPELVREAGLPSPFTDGALAEMAQKVVGIAESLG